MPEPSKDKKIESLVNDPLQFQAFNMVIDKLRSRLKNKQEANSDNFIRKNRSLIRNWQEYEFTRRQKLQDSFHNNLDGVLKRKEENLKFKREKQALYRKLKEQIKELERRRELHIQRWTAWTIIFKQDEAVHQSIKKFDNKKLKIKRIKLELGWKIKLYYRYAVYCRKKGNSLTTRITRDLLRYDWL